ncbi:winged helix-turn-helix transcriptional regulator [Colwellia demingiae]|uniref:Winged helix-turn-helix transcriptional regulator n=1 Tax=Colwellia demingiae TaxID=89401 RepID=A0A5C6QCC5_9GAMM|nr:winged helix-turn-helix domain-containing protein [Colwellia demingiae]TWX66262.1 winged helix-turn-helix transcriptional regulator [Colwellia demingiae]
MLTTEKHVTPDKMLIAQVELNFLNRSVLFLGKSVTTTGLEFNLLAVLMNDAGSLVSREVIAQRIFQRKLDSCDKSINSHMANLRKKLLVISSRPVIKTVKGQGYIFLTSSFATPVNA